MTGIDISQWQRVIAPGAWDFIICRATHDGLGEDLMFDQHFPAALKLAPRRGAYHFAKPTVSTGATQAHHFAQVCSAQGFRKNVDLWALDFEANPLPTNTANVAWIIDFMVTARALLGARGMLYVGWPFFVETVGAENVSLLHSYAWWLPAYGPNDGQPHTPNCPFLPVVHQFTSRGGPNGSGLDVNRVLDVAGWNRLTSIAPAPKPPTTVKVRPVISATHPPVDAKCIKGFPLVLTSDGGVFDPEHGGIFYGSPVGQPYWKGRVAAALAVKGDPRHPLTDEEVAAGKTYAVVDSAGNHYAFGPKG